MFSFARIKRSAPAFIWLIAFAAIPLWLNFDPGGWDVGIYHDAIRSLVKHRDPYADALALQNAFLRTLAQHPWDTGPFSYVRAPFSYIYPPITLPLLELTARLPLSLAATLYWLLYALSACSIAWVGLQGANSRERKVFAFLAPASMCLPGLLHNDTILSGNVVIIFYGFVLAATVFGWRTGRWRWCYLAILIASCFKLPLLTLLALPLLSARKQVLPAAITAATSLLLFGAQSILCPTLFHHFLDAVGHQFAYIRDFGCSPSGLVSNFLYSYGFSYSVIGPVVYLAYAVPLFGLLLLFSRDFLRGHLTLQQWAPVLLVGVVLLNPRIMQYDTFVLALPMGLIAWRALTRRTSRRFALLILALVLATANFSAVQSLELWRLTEGVLLVLAFAAGCWDLGQHRAKRLVPSQRQPEAMPLPDRLAA